MSEFQKDITETENWVILRTEDESKAQVISSDDGWSSLAVNAEHSPALESKCDSFFVYRKGWSCQNQVTFVLVMLCYKSLNIGGEGDSKNNCKASTVSGFSLKLKTHSSFSFARCLYNIASCFCSSGTIFFCC